LAAAIFIERLEGLLSEIRVPLAAGCSDKIINVPNATPRAALPALSLSATLGEEPEVEVALI